MTRLIHRLAAPDPITRYSVIEAAVYAILGAMMVVFLVMAWVSL